ncbi:hypothetical protein ACOSP7_013734 [Xanthoceras sorbifolium]
MYFQPGLSNLLLFGWWRTMQLALREMPARRVGPGLLLARKNRSLASRTSGGPIWRHTENHAFRTARLPNKKINGLVGKRSAACRAHVMHSRVAHAADLSL